MLILISPAKTLDLQSQLPRLPLTQPRFLDQTAELVALMQEKSPAELCSLMRISEDLGVLNAQRYQDFEFPFTQANARPALLTFAGDVYQGLNALERFDSRDYTEATKTLRILSGLYGVLRPLDLIQPYRLEMGVKLRNPAGNDLYRYWRDRLTTRLRQDLAESPGAEVVLNCASAEYATAIDFAALDVPILSPRFEDRNPRGEWKVMSFSAKRARGMFAGWAIQNRVRTLRQLQDFAEGGYRYVEELSHASVPVFRRLDQA
ncbi:MAG: peroxide stress protein YaaA [Propionibacteriaceae bacterium]